MFFSMVFMFLFSLLLGFSSKKFFIFWMSLEISGLCMMALFWNNFFSSQTFLYFLVTAFSGALLFFSWINNWYFFSCLVMFFKMGVWPFSSWVLKVCQKLDFFKGFMFLFLLKFLPFYGIFIFFSNFFYFFIFVALMKLLGTTLKLLSESYFSVYKMFLWLSMSSVSYWIMMGMFSFFLFLVCYLVYSIFMFFVLYYQNKKMKNFHLWMLSFLLFLGGPPLFYLFFKMFFFYSLSKKFFFMGCLTFIFFFQSMVLIRVLIFSNFSMQKKN